MVGTSNRPFGRICALAVGIKGLVDEICRCHGFCMILRGRATVSRVPRAISCLVVIRITRSLTRLSWSFRRNMMRREKSGSSLPPFAQLCVARTTVFCCSRGPCEGALGQPRFLVLHPCFLTAARFPCMLVGGGGAARDTMPGSGVPDAASADRRRTPGEIVMPVDRCCCSCRFVRSDASGKESYLVPDEQGLSRWEGKPHERRSFNTKELLMFPVHSSSHEAVPAVVARGFLSGGGVTN